MSLIRDRRKATRFIDSHEESLTMRRTRDATGEIGIEIVIVEPTDNLVPIVEEAAKEGLVVRFDGSRIVIEEPPDEPLEEEVTVEPLEIRSGDRIEEPMNPEVEGVTS